MPDLERPWGSADEDGPPRFRHQIEAGVSISGRIHFPGAARIDGNLKGEIRADGLLIVGASAEVEATVTARRMVLAGTMRGDVVGSGTIELESTARLTGNVEASTLVVHDGAFFDGRATIGAPSRRREPNAPGSPGAAAGRRRANG